MNNISLYEEAQSSINFDQDFIYGQKDGTDVKFSASAFSNSLGSYVTLNTTQEVSADKTWTGSHRFTQDVDCIAMKARWADLAEYYIMDKVYPVGTLVCFGGKNEMTIAKDYVNAVISKDPALLINTSIKSKKNAQPIALVGRVQVRVIGKVNKFDLIGLDPENPGVAKKVTNKDLAIGRVLKGKNKSEEDLVLCVIKMEI